jgi:hypothetical protein
MDEDEGPCQDSTSGRAEEWDELAWFAGTGGKIKYPHSSLIDTRAHEYAHASHREAKRKWDALTFEIYRFYSRMVAKLVRKYGHFTNHSDEEDMRQTVFVAVLEMLNKYKYEADISMKVSSFLDWKVKNLCARYANNAKDMFIEVTAPDGTLYRRMPYGEWQAHKKKLIPRGYTGTSVRPQQLSALFGNDGGPDDNISTSLMDMDEPLVESTFTMEEDEPFVEPDRDIRQEIDTVYRTARHMDIGSPANSHVLRKVYNLCHPYLLKLALQYAATGIDLEMPLWEVAETVIVMTWKTYEENNTMPGARYSFFLESNMRRKLPVLLGWV